MRFQILVIREGSLASLTTSSTTFLFFTFRRPSLIITLEKGGMLTVYWTVSGVSATVILLLLCPPFPPKATASELKISKGERAGFFDLGTETTKFSIGRSIKLWKQAIEVPS